MKGPLYIYSLSMTLKEILALSDPGKLLMNIQQICFMSVQQNLQYIKNSFQYLKFSDSWDHIILVWRYLGIKIFQIFQQTSFHFNVTELIFLNHFAFMWILKYTIWLVLYNFKPRSLAINKSIKLNTAIINSDFY